MQLRSAALATPVAGYAVVVAVNRGGHIRRHAEKVLWSEGFVVFSFSFFVLRTIFAHDPPPMGFSYKFLELIHTRIDTHQEAPGATCSSCTGSFHIYPSGPVIYKTPHGRTPNLKMSEEKEYR